MGYVNENLKVGDCAYDVRVKEYVLISNAICTLDHSGPDAFKASHGEHGMGACLYTPHEATCLRVADVAENGRPILSYVIRGVEAGNLEATRPDIARAVKEMFDRAFSRRRSAYWIGRVS